MPLKLIRADITTMEVDAVVNAANSSLLGGGGVDGAIHNAAGRGLLEECRTLGGCGTGGAKVTGGYNMPCKYIIHTVGPVWHGGDSGEEELLRSCYRKSLRIALEKKCESIAFPLISSGIYGYPKSEALKVATEETTEFLERNESDMMIYIVIFDQAAFEYSSRKYADIEQRIDNEYALQQYNMYSRSRTLQNNITPDAMPCKMCAEEPSRPKKRPKAAHRKKAACKEAVYEGEVFEESVFDAAALPKECIKPEHLSPVKSKTPSDLPIIGLNTDICVDESFSQMVLRKIDEKGMKDSQIYHRANMDRKLFSKIRSNVNYHPSKTTAAALIIALELPIDEANEMMMKAGFAFSSSIKFDIIVSTFIKNGVYNIYDINEVLFKNDQELLCSTS